MRALDYPMIAGAATGAAPARQRMLFLCDRTPTRTGDARATRAFAWLERLSARFDTVLAAPIDGVPRTLRLPDGRRAALDALADLSGFAAAGRTDSGWARRRFAAARRRAQPDAALRAEHQARPFDLLLLSGVGAAGRLQALGAPSAPLIVDLADREAEALRAGAAGSVETLLDHARQWRARGRAARLDRIERLLAERAAALCFGDEPAARRFRARGAAQGWVGEPSTGAQMVALPSGLAAPDAVAADPEASAARGPIALLWVSADRPPATEAALWFVREALPRLRAQVPELQFVAAGPGARAAARRLRRITPARRALQVARTDAASRAWLARADLAVSLVGGGAPAPALQTMAAGVATLTTPAGAAGLDVLIGRDLVVAEGAAGLADAARRLIGEHDRRGRIAAAGAARVATAYDWPSRLDPLERLVDRVLAGAARPGEI